VLDINSNWSVTGLIGLLGGLLLGCIWDGIAKLLQGTATTRLEKLWAFLARPSAVLPKLEQSFAKEKYLNSAGREAARLISVSLPFDWTCGQYSVEVDIGTSANSDAAVMTRTIETDMATAYRSVFEAGWPIAQVTVRAWLPRGDVERHVYGTSLKGDNARSIKWGNLATPVKSFWNVLFYDDQILAPRSPASQ
jgi:hypothetical protein